MLAAGCVHSENSPSDPAPYVPGEVMVKFKDGTSPEAVTAVLAAEGASVKRLLGGSLTYVVAVPPGRSVEAAVARFRAHAEVADAEPNRIIRIEPRPSRGGESLAK
jgi:hypothetical protein